MSSRWNLDVLPAVAVALVFAFTLPGGSGPVLAAEGRTPSTCGRTWTPVAITHFGRDNLTAVDSTSSSDVWAVGASGGAKPLAQHWDGASWTPVPSPSPGNPAAFTSVSALSPTDVWAVGDYSPLGHPFSEHWDGSSWSLVSMPELSGVTYMNAVTAIASDDLWAVGSSAASKGPLTLHWDGTAWQEVPNPPIGSGNLTAVSAVSSADVWAVGAIGQDTLTEHWDGSAWTVVSSPSPGPWGNDLTGVVAIATDDVWAVGWFKPDNVRSRVLTEHWDGSSWAAVRGYWSPTQSEALNGVAALDSSDVWGVGYDQDRFIETTTVAGWWNGSVWRRTSSVSVGSGPQLFGVTVTSDGSGWAVGRQGSNAGQKALIEQACGI